jgi:hypothetical protein
MKTLACFFLLSIIPALSQAQLLPPTNLTATWIQESGVRKVSLSWQSNSAGSTTGWRIERKIAANAWTNLSGASSLSHVTTTYKDGTISNSPSTLTYYRFRVRALNGSAHSGWAEVDTAGIPSAWPTTHYDSDCDGVTDSAETAAGLNPSDWADGSGDNDGDLVPNAWEAGLGRSITAVNNIAPHVTVDASYTGTDTSTLTKTINAAIAKLTGTANLHRIILVKPGIYKENINHTASYQIALIADRSGSNPKKECEIQGITNDPVISTDGSLVVDGFVITRAPGTKGAALSVTQPVNPVSRVHQTRLTNCIVRNMDNGSSSIIIHNRGRLVVSHCTFFMNSVIDTSYAHSYSTGPLTGTEPLESTSRLKVWNSIFWNPINIRVPEFQSVGDWSINTSICYGQSLPGTEQINPGLTPKGYLLSNSLDPNSNEYCPASTGGSLGAQVLKDMHGEIRYNPPGRGADDWYDLDQDKIPDFWDSDPLNAANAMQDLDEDFLTEYGEYLAGTSLESADSQYLTLEQGVRLFGIKEEILQGYLTRTEGDARYMPLNATPLKTLRVAPGGDIDMGIFQ